MSQNPFALLAGDEDGSEAGDLPLPKRTAPAQVDAAPGKGPAKSGSIPTAAVRRVVGQKPKASESRANDEPAGSQAQFEGERGRDDRGTGFGRGGRGGPRGGRGGERGRGRGGRGGRGGADRPDRRSQTGREDSAKAEHQGWGGDEGKRELEAENAGLGDASAEKATDGTEKTEGEAKATTNGEKAAEEAPAAPAEPEDKSVTYEEYLKSRMDKSSISGVNQLQARKANEGADDAQWKDGVAITKSDEEYFAAAKKEKAAKEKARKEKTFLDVEFSAPRREERPAGAGGRGGFRGGRGRGEGGERSYRGRGEGRGRGSAPRGGRGSSNAGINVDDNKAFPSLA